MKCAIHSDREAVGTCGSCGRLVCPECKASIGGQEYCNSCVQIRLKAGEWPGKAGNTSGAGVNVTIPPEVKGWNWGAFLLTWIWGVGNNVWISLIALLGFLPYIGWIVSLTMRIILGIRGNEWAWQYKRWDSIEHFKKTQRTWMWWGVSFLILWVLLVFSVILLLISLYKIGATMGLDKYWQWKDIMPRQW